VKNQINLSVNTDLGVLSNVLSWFNKINIPPIANQQIWWQCQTLLVEGFTNIVEHAHKNLPKETPIDIEVLRSDKYINIYIYYQGKYFDLEQQLQVIPELEENEAERGRGLKIMAAIADKLSYEKTEDNRYCLFISKYY
jgi:serine/threonine-protein kinase RsbW